MEKYAKKISGERLLRRRYSPEQHRARSHREYSAIE